MKSLLNGQLSRYSLFAGVIVVLSAITLSRLRPVSSGTSAPPAPPARSSNSQARKEKEDPPSRSDPRLSAAVDALARRDFSTAFRLCETARKQGAALTDVLTLQAAIFKETGYLDREMETLRQWAKAAPENVRPWLKLFYIYLDLGWRQEADESVKRALELAPQDPRSHVARALFYYRSNSAELGIKPMEEARRLDPANLEFANLQEAILIKARHFPEAELQVRKTLASAAPQTQEQLTLVHALLGQNKTQEAEALLRAVQQREPDNVEAAYELGAQAEKRGDLAEATRLFEKAVALDSRFNNVLWRLGRLYIQQGRTQEGQKLLKTFETLDRNTTAYEMALNRLKSRPNDADLHYKLASYHLAAEEFPQAIVELRRVLELRHQDAKARQELVQALTQHGRVTEAKQLDGTAGSPPESP